MLNSDRQVVIQRTFPAGIERLWEAFTNIDDILKWHSPVGMTNPDAEVDLRVGGKYAVTMEYNETGEKVTVRGMYKEIDKPRKLVFTWKWDGSEMDTLVEVEFSQISENETEIILTHSEFDEHPSEVDLKNNWTQESHKAGWTTAFQKLDALIHN